MHNVKLRHFPVASFAIGLLIVSACTVSVDDNNKNGAKAPVAQTGPNIDTAAAVSTDFSDDDSASMANALAAAMADTLTDTTAALASITPQTASSAPTTFPVAPAEAGPATLHMQILLDRANFSPGVLTGVWDDNGRHALTWFRVSHGLDSNAVVDRAAYAQLTSAAGPKPLFQQYTVTEDDANGPFVTIPAHVYQKAKLDCLCYQSIGEELGERFHSTQSLLRRLNPGTDLKTLKAGSTLWVPNVARDTAGPAPYTTARIMISKKDFWTHAIDSAGRIVAHYPSTLGNSYDPSPTGDFSVARIARHPTFHYQPTLFHEVPDDQPEAYLAKGPNSPVGVIWIALSKEHYGIHGNDDPASIGVTQSHGCVRLTNWDAWTLGSSVQPGVPVTFQP